METQLLGGGWGRWWMYCTASMAVKPQAKFNPRVPFMVRFWLLKRFDQG